MIRRFIRSYIPRHVPTYLAGLGFLFATTWVAITVPKVIGALIDQLQQPGMDFVAIRPTLVRLIMLAFALAFFRSLSRVALFYPGRRVEQEVRQDFFTRMVFLPQPVYSRYRVGDLMSRGVNDVTSVRAMLSMGVLHSVNTLFLGVGAVHGMATLSLPLTLWVLLPLAGLMAATGLAVRYLFRYVRASQEALGMLSEASRETLGAYALLNAYPIEAGLLGRFGAVNEKYSRAVERVAAARALIFPMMSTFIGMGVLLVLWIGGRMVLGGELALGSLVAFMAYVWILADPAIAIGWVMNSMQRGYSALQRIYEVASQGRPEEWQAAESDQPLERVEVRGLRYRYPEPQGGGFCLEIDRLDVRRGGRVGVFGPTGSGKSTLALLLAGVLPAEPGMIFFNGEEATGLPLPQRRRWTGLVPQQTLLFSTTIQENICLARPLEAPRMAAAIEQAALAGDISGFPQGLRTKVGEGGISLSGGQRQRVSLARALYHGADLLILDDMTSAVDLLTEAALLQRLFARDEGRMLLMISHRVSTLQACDEIIVLENGRVADRGRHQELVERNALYRGTWEYEQAMLSEEAAR